MQVALKLYKILDTYPKNAIKGTENLWRHRLRLESDVKMLHENVDAVLKGVTKSVHNLPENVTDVFKNSIHPNLQKVIQKYEKNQLALMDAFYKSGK